MSLRVSMSRLIEEPHVLGNGSAEVFAEGLLAHDVNPCPKGLLQLAVEPAHLEQAHALRGLDTEIVVAVGAVVTAGPGAEEVHPENPVLGGDGSDYLTELLERVLPHFVHNRVIVSTLINEGRTPTAGVRRPLSITSQA